MLYLMIEISCKKTGAGTMTGPFPIQPGNFSSSAKLLHHLLRRYHECRETCASYSIIVYKEQRSASELYHQFTTIFNTF